MTSTTSTSASLDMRGKTITTYIAYEAAQRLRTLAEGDTLELLTGTGDAIGNDIRAWCHATGHQLASAASAGTHCRYVIIKGALQRPGKSLAAVVSDPGLEELLSPLGFATPPPWRASMCPCTSRVRQSGCWPRASPRNCADGAGRSAGSPGLDSRRPGTSRQRRRSDSSRPWAPALRLRALDAALPHEAGRHRVQRRHHRRVPDFHRGHD